MMKKLSVILFIILSHCHSDNPGDATLFEVKSILDFYKQYSYYTDPGEYCYLYQSLPDSLSGLCELIKCQFIHPVDLNPYRHLFPQNRHYEDVKFPTVKKLLMGLIDLDANGLTCDRKPENRLVVTCRYHAVFLASILKYRGIPTRVRYGFAPYLAPNRDLHICHVICEVWNKKRKCWMLVDPDRKMINFPKNDFEFPGDAWLHYQQGEITQPEKYGVAQTWGAYHILDMLCHDLASVLGKEHLYWERPPIAADEQVNLKKTGKEQIDVLTKISHLLKNPDENMNELIAIYNKNDFIKYD